MRLAAAGIALVFLASLGTGAWCMLPRWCPRLVIRYSPWVYPVLRSYEFSGVRYYPDFEFCERFERWGRPVLPYLHQVLFTHPDGAMRHASMEALNALAGWTDTLSLTDQTVAEATFLALSDEVRYPDVGSVPELSEWLAGDDGPDALRSVYRSLDVRRQAVLIDRLPFPGMEYWFTQSPRLIRCYLEFLADPDRLVSEQVERLLRRMTKEAAFPDCYFIAQMVQPTSPRALDDVLTDLLRSLDEPSDVSGIISWLGRSSAQPVAQMHLAYACTFLRNPTAVPALSATLTATDPGVRIHVLQALREIGDVRAFDAVIPLLSDTDDSVRCMAVWTIGRLRDSRAKDLLKRALEDPDPLVALAAERSLAEFLPSPSISDD